MLRNGLTERALIFKFVRTDDGFSLRFTVLPVLRLRGLFFLLVVPKIDVGIKKIVQ